VSEAVPLRRELGAAGEDAGDPALRIVVPIDSSRSASASSSFGVVNMQRMSWFA
jgi:hypothetical protein